MPVKVRLNLMMFLEYAVKGLWFPLASVFLTETVAKGGLGFSELEKGKIIGIPFAVGAVLSPFVGQICDRFFPAQRTLGVLLVATGILMMITAKQTSYHAWLILGTAFAILYVPTVSVTNSLAMSHLGDAKSEFPKVRVWGTIGWIAVGWVFPMIWLQHGLGFQWLPPFLKGTEYDDVIARMIDAVSVAGMLAIAYGLFCFFGLPHTPPAKRESGQGMELAQLGALLKKKSFVVVLLVSLLIASVHTIYFFQMGSFLKAAGLDGSDVMPAMSLGQFSEIAVMALLGGFLMKFGFRWTMAFGAFCFGVRYLIFAQTGLPVGVHVAAQLLHGFCFACFFAAAFIYVDRVAPKEMRHSAQTLYTLVMFGLGPILATKLNGWLATRAETADGKLTLAGFGTYWEIAGSVAIVCAILFAIFFRDETEDLEKA
ncbi:MAG: MFS transporter [Verrucomicrobiae bacterium]|nr:MFS transporter [Verrucomicrobiae bacterium]